MEDRSSLSWRALIRFASGAAATMRRRLRSRSFSGARPRSACRDGARAQGRAQLARGLVPGRVRRGRLVGLGLILQLPGGQRGDARPGGPPPESNVPPAGFAANRRGVRGARPASDRMATPTIVCPTRSGIAIPGAFAPAPAAPIALAGMPTMVRLTLDGTPGQGALA